MTLAEMRSSPLTIAIVAGEASGDQLGASLIHQIKSLEPDAKFVGVGGSLMLAEGFPDSYDMETLSVNGFFDPILRLPALIKLMLKLRREIINKRPSCFVGIDSNFFNLMLAGFLKKKGIKTIQYVSPSIWAWRQGRVKKIARRVDLVLTLYPFEALVFKENSVKAEFVGHPVASEYLNIDYEALKTDARRDLKISPDKKVVAILPGSRRSEVAMSGRDFLETAIELREHVDKFLIPAANPKRYQQLFSMLGDFPELQGKVRLFRGNSKKVMSAADAVLVNSGTATLEAMLLRKPMVMSYRLGKLTHLLVSKLIRTNLFALPNILAGEKIVPEFIQDKAKPKKMAKAIKHFLGSTEQHALFLRYNELHSELCGSGVRDDEASQAILKFCKEN